MPIAIGIIVAVVLWGCGTASFPEKQHAVQVTVGEKQDG